MPIYFFLYIYFHDFSVKNYLILYAKQSKLGVLRKLRPRKHRSQTPKTQTPGRTENTDPPKNSDPLGVSKTPTPQKSLTPWVYRKHRPPQNLRPPGCIENTDPPKNTDPLSVSKTQTPRVYRKLRLPGRIENTDPRKIRSTGCLENSDSLGFSKMQTPGKLRPPPRKVRPLDVLKNSDSKFNIFQIL